MENELVQAILEMSVENGKTVDDIFNLRPPTSADYTHLDGDFRMQQTVSSLRQMSKETRELDMPPPQDFLGRKEPQTRGELERLAAMDTFVPNANHQMPDGMQYREQVERPDPKLAHLQQRDLPSNRLMPEFEKTKENVRTPNMTDIPVTPFQARMEKEVTREPERFEDGYVANPSTLYGIDQTRYLHQLVYNVPERYHTDLYSRQYPTEQRGFERMGYGPDGYRLREDHHLIEPRQAAAARTDLGDLLNPTMIMQARDPTLEVPIPGANRNGDAPRDDRAGMDMYETRKGYNIAMENAEVRSGMGQFNQDHLTKSLVTLFNTVTRPDIVRDDVYDEIHHVQRNQNPYAIPFTM